MEAIGYKKNALSVIERLKSLYTREAEDRIFASFQMPSTSMDNYRRINRLGYTDYPDPTDRAAFWDSLLQEKMFAEDDSIPSAYLSEFDQGLYGALIGGKMQFLNDPQTGWISSMVKPMYEKLPDFELPQTDPGHPWFGKYLKQMEVFSEYSASKFGISHFILIDSLNFIFELVGATKTYLSLFECPEKVREVMDFAFELNVRVQETFFNNTPSFHGGTFSNMAQWIPGRIVSESVDPFHMTSVEDYETWGESNLERMFGHFDGGIMHLHSNGRHLLQAVSRLKDLKAIYLQDEKDNPPAFEILPELKKQSGDLPLIVHVEDHVFLDHLEKRLLPGGVFYLVNTGRKIDEVNRTMDKVRKYRR